MAKLEVGGRRRLCAVVILGLIPVVLAATGPAQAMAPTPAFAPAVTYGAGTAKGVLIGDFTGDGRNDVLVAVTDRPDTPRADRLYLFGQGADGRLTRVDVIETAAGFVVGAGMAAGDFDGDGRTDAAVVGDSTVEVLLQRDGRLSAGQVVPSPPFLRLEAADLTGDGRADIVGAGWNGLHLLRNLGNATFAPPESRSSQPQKDIQVGDITGDGRVDVVSCPAARGVMVFAQLPTGGLADPSEQPGIAGCVSLALADLNGDGRTDVSFVGRGNAPERLYLLLQQPSGALAAPTSYFTYNQSAQVRAADMNGDRRSDLVVAHGYYGRELGIHAQAPDHTLDPERIFDIPDSNGPFAPGFAVGDVNGDGYPDIAVADNENGLVVLPGRQAGPSTTTSTSMLPPASPFGASTSSRPELFGPTQTYDLGSGAESIVAGDFNGDGRADLATVTRGQGNAGPGLYVLYQGADGALARTARFDTEVAISNTGGSSPTLAAGDLDGDGLQDLVLRMWEGVDIFLQRDGGFADRVYRELQPSTRADIADLDGDGKGDLITSGVYGIFVHRSLGGTTFASAVAVEAETRTEQVAIGDVTGDGRPDIVTADDSIVNGAIRGSVVVYRQRADHSFEPGALTDAGGRYGTVAIGDFNADGRQDVAVSYAVDHAYVEKIRILAQTAGGTLTQAGDLDHASYAGPLRAGDLNGDGLTDLVALVDGGYVDTWVQQNGRLEPYMRNFVSGAYFRSTTLAVADFSGDRRLDVATANTNIGVEVLRNVTTAGAFHPLTPARILDTRTGVGAPAARLGPEGTLSLQVAGVGGVPAGGATAVVLNVTVTEPTAGSFLTAWPTLERRPLASNLNFVAGQTVPNLVTVRLGMGGKVDLYNLAGTTHVIADVAGWYGVDYADEGSRYTPVTPARILDTRTGVGATAQKLGSSGTLGLQVTGRGGVPAAGVSSVVLNVTVTEPTAGGFLTAWPAGQNRPLASNLNFVAGQTVPNLVVVKVGAAGVVNLFNLAGATHVIADVAGWFGPGQQPPAGGFQGITPVRIVDTRAGLGAPPAKLGPGSTLAVKVLDRGGVPSSGVGAVVLNVTVTEPAAGGYLTVSPRGEARPLASNLNFEAGQTVPNQVVVKVGATGEINVFNGAGATHVIVDVAGWYWA